MCAQEARWQLALDEVVLMPVGQAPHRRIEQDPGAEERYELCRLAAEGVDWLKASRAEVERDGPSYTADTLEEFRGGELFFVVGADQALRLSEWHEPERVLRAATLAVVERDGLSIDDVRAAVSAVGEARIEPVAMPRIDVSSTEIRRRVAQGRPVRYLTPDPVLELIEAMDLYREAVRA